MLIKPNTLKTSNLSHLLRDKWFDKTLAEFKAEVDKLKLTKPVIDFESDREIHTWVKQSIKDKNYILIAYILSRYTDILEQSPMAYAIAFNDVNLVMAMLACGQDINGQYYKDIDSTEFYYPLTLAMGLKKEYVFNLLLLHPLIDVMYEQAFESEDSEISVFMGDDYLYDYVKPLNRLFEAPYHDALPYLNIDLEIKIDRDDGCFSCTLFETAAENNDFAKMDLLYSLGANVFVMNDDSESRFTYALQEFNEKGSSKILDWYASKIKPIMQTCTHGFDQFHDGFAYTGLMALFQGSSDYQVFDEKIIKEQMIREQLIDKFGLTGWNELIEDKQSELFDLKEKKQRANYRTLYPNLITPEHIEPERLHWLNIAEDFVVEDLKKNPVIPHKKIEPISVFDDLRRIYRGAFYDDVQDVKVSMQSEQLELTIKRKVKPELTSIEIHLLPEDTTRIILGHEFERSDLSGLTGYQLMTLFLNSSLDNLLAINDYLSGTNQEIFWMDNLDGYLYQRGMFNPIPEEQKYYVKRILKDLVI